MSFLSKCGATLAALTLPIIGVAQDVPVEKYKLDNGMTVILRVDHTVPLATVNIWYRVGSKDEPPRHSGFAHLFEHLMFMGTNRVPTGQFDKIMEGGGGDNNASTAEDRTNYYDQGPSNLLPTLLWLEADRLQDLGKAMTLKKLNLQRDVVKNERRQNTENTPYGSAYEMVNGLMFPPGHPYHTSVIGSMTDLDNASVKDVQNFFATYYVPNNASLVVAGDFNPTAIKTQIAKLFGTLPRKPAVPRKSAPPLPLLGIKRVTLSDKVEVPKIIMTWHSPAAYKPGDAEIQLAASVLADGLNSRLYQRLVVKDKLASAVSAFQEQRLLGSVFYVDLTASAGADLKRLESETDAELSRFAAEGPSQVELRRQSTKIESGTLNGLQSLGNVADSLNTYEFYLGHPNGFREVLDRFRNATPEAVKSVAAKTLDLNNRAIITVLPVKTAPTPTSTGEAPERFGGKQKQASLTYSDPRDGRPPLGKPKEFSVPVPTTFTLRNGIKVEYWQRSALPLMTVDLELDGGANQDPLSKPGLTELTASLLTQGAGTRNAQEYQNALDILGADVGVSVSRRRVSVRLNVLSRNFKTASALFSDAILRPRFSDPDFERVKRVKISALEQAQDDVGTVASTVAAREFFGRDSLLGRPVSGTPKTVESISLQEVRSQYRSQFEPRFGTFYAAGSLPLTSVKKILDDRFGTWSGSGKADLPKAIAPVNPPSNLKVFLVDKPGAVQTAIRFLMPAKPYNSPERLGLTELGTLLGGSFTSRLNQNLREDKGYTYGAFSQFSLDKERGGLYASASVRADVTGASLKEFLKEFDRLRSGDISDAEVRKAAATIRTQQVNAVSTLDGLTEEAAGLAIFGRPITALTDDAKGMAKIDAASLNRLAKSSVPYENGVLVLVGDKTVILKQLTDLKLPEPEVVTAY